MGLGGKIQNSVLTRNSSTVGLTQRSQKSFTGTKQTCDEGIHGQGGKQRIGEVMVKEMGMSRGNSRGNSIEPNNYESAKVSTNNEFEEGNR